MDPVPDHEPIPDADADRRGRDPADDTSDPSATGLPAPPRSSRSSTRSSKPGPTSPSTSCAPPRSCSSRPRRSSTPADRAVDEQQDLRGRIDGADPPAGDATVHPIDRNE